MASKSHDDPWVDKLFAIAIEREHAYKSDRQMATSLLSSVTDILQSTGISYTAAVKLAISYIHFDSAHNSVLKPHTAMGIIHLLRDAIETELDNVDLEDDIAVTQAESVILEYPEIVLPWLWRASHYGIQSDFAQSSTSLWLLFHYRHVPDLEGQRGEADDAIMLVLEDTSSANDVLEGLLTTAFDLRSIPSFTRLIRILLRLTAFLETRSNRVPGSRLGYITFDAYVTSWSSDMEMPLDGWKTFFWYLTNIPLENLRGAIIRMDVDSPLLCGKALCDKVDRSYSITCREYGTVEKLGAITTPKPRQRALTNIIRSPILVGDVIVEHIWIISGLSFFLHAEFLGWSKKQGLQIYMLYSAIAGTVARLIASLREGGINIIRNGSEAAEMIEQLCFSSRSELLMSCDGILAFTVATRTLWGNEKEAGAISLHVVNMIHRIILEDKHCLRRLLSRVNDALGIALDIAPQSAKKYLSNSTWNVTICRLLLDKYLRDEETPLQFSEELLRLLLLIMSPCESSMDRQNWVIMYAATRQEQLLRRFRQHRDRHEMNAAARLLGILRLTMKNDSEGDKLKVMEETIGSDMNELLSPEADKHFYLIRPYLEFPAIISL